MTARPWLFACLLLALLAPPRPSWARADVRVVASLARLELAADGSASVRHELTIEVSSGVLHALRVQGLDADARALPDAELRPLGAAAGGSAGASAAQPLELRIEEGRAELGVPQPSGARGKSFSVAFGYRTQLARRGLIRDLADGQHVELSWLGPRFEDGLDSVTLVVRTRPAAEPPEAGDPSSGAPRASPGNFSIVMSTLRRSAQQDELEIVRAHVARNEAARWRVRLDRSLFEQAASAGNGAASAASRDTAPLNPASLDPASPDELQGLELDDAWPPPERGVPRPRAATTLPWILAAALAYALLLAAKATLVQQAAALRGCRVRALLGGAGRADRIRYRAAAAGLLLVGASSSVIWLDTPLLGALALLLALGLAAHRPPSCEALLRGPGQWQPLDARALDPDPVAPPPLPGAWLDVGRLQGFLLLLALLGALSALALRCFESSPYYGACLLLGSAALLPLFCTGRAAELPEAGLAQSRRFLARVLKRLQGDAKLVAQPLGRSCAGATELDEVRLAIHPAACPPGWIGMELALEFRAGPLGQSAWPVLVIRAADASECQRALPRQLRWTRGRTAEERAALLRPKLPSAALSVELILELVEIAARPLAPNDPSVPQHACASVSSALAAASDVRRALLASSSDAQRRSRGRPLRDSTRS